MVQVVVLLWRLQFYCRHTFRKVDESIVPYLAEVADQTEQTGLTFVVDEADHMICLRLKSYWGMVVGKSSNKRL